SHFSLHWKGPSRLWSLAIGWRQRLAQGLKAHVSASRVIHVAIGGQTHPAGIEKYAAWRRWLRPIRRVRRNQRAPTGGKAVTQRRRRRRSADNINGVTYSDYSSGVVAGRTLEIVKSKIHVADADIEKHVAAERTRLIWRAGK